MTIQAQILELMKELREQNGMAIMLITHDLGVVAEMADEVVVMYAGKVVERADAITIFEQPQHPYTKGLLASIPKLGEKRQRLEVIKGVVPNPLNLPTGCLFKRRCPVAMPVCDSHAAGAPARRATTSRAAGWNPMARRPRSAPMPPRRWRSKAAETLSVEPLVLPDPDTIDRKGSAS